MKSSDRKMHIYFTQTKNANEELLILSFHIFFPPISYHHFSVHGKIVFEIVHKQRQTDRFHLLAFAMQFVCCFISHSIPRCMSFIVIIFVYFVAIEKIQSDFYSKMKEKKQKYETKTTHRKHCSDIMLSIVVFHRLTVS